MERRGSGDVFCVSVWVEYGVLPPRKPFVVVTVVVVVGKNDVDDIGDVVVAAVVVVAEVVFWRMYLPQRTVSSSCGLVAAITIFIYTLFF